MAAPTYYPIWADIDQNLPATGEPNKERPKTTLRNIGWDKGQIPSAEEMNWMMNNFYLWIKYFDSELIPAGLRNDNTKITLAGEVTGTATFSGTNELSITTTVAASSTASSANTLVRRNSDQSIRGGDLYSYATSSSDSASLFLVDPSGVEFGEMSAAPGAAGAVFILSKNPVNGAVVSSIYLQSGYITLTAPRSASGQETTGSALVRYDTFSANVSNLQNSINTVNSNLSNSINSNVNNLSAAINQLRTDVARTYVTNIRLVNRAGWEVGGDAYEYANGYVVTTGGDFGASNGYYLGRQLQYQINGNWFTANYG